MPRPIQVTIDRQALRHNLVAVKRCFAYDHYPTPPAVWAVIKAHAYGHGILPAVTAFAEADGLAMVDFEEVALCRQAGWQKPILLLEGFFEPADIALLAEYRVTTAIHCWEQLAMLATSDLRAQINALIILNSGLHRLGFQPDEYREAFAQASELSKQGILGELSKMMHFAVADEDPVYTQKQIDCFNEVTATLPGSVSVLNSAMTLTPGSGLAIPASRHWHRPGICLFGGSPFSDRPAAGFGLRPAMTFTARLISTHTVLAGEAIGYGLLFRAERDTHIGIVSCGCSDGYPRHAPTGTPITVAGVRTRVLGRISMDMMAVDLTRIPEAEVGSPVVLWGEGGPTVDEVAHAAGTVADELLTGITARVTRHVI